MECTRCGEELREEEEQSPSKDENGDVICDACERDEYKEECGACWEEYDNRHHEPTHFVITGHTTGEEPGYYKIIRYPIYTSNYMSAWFNEGSIKKVADLIGNESQLDRMEPAGMLCKKCTRKTRRRYQEYAAKKRRTT